jgi:hypothetical protein
LGDFNSLLSQDDKHNGVAVSSYEVADFKNCCSDLGLYDLNYTGCHFSWTNGRVWSKIDRVLTNPFWSSFQSQVHIYFGNSRAFSNHFPAIIRLTYQHVRGKRCFKFFNIWANHDSFLELVADKWNLYVQRSPMFILCKKLKHLKKLNKLHFSHISKRVSRVEMELEAHQSAFHHDKDNFQHLALDKQL